MPFALEDPPRCELCTGCTRPILTRRRLRSMAVERGCLHWPSTAEMRQVPAGQIAATSRACDALAHWLQAVHSGTNGGSDRSRRQRRRALVAPAPAPAAPNGTGSSSADAFVIGDDDESLNPSLAAAAGAIERRRHLRLRRNRLPRRRRRRPCCRAGEASTPRDGRDQGATGAAQQLQALRVRPLLLPRLHKGFVNRKLRRVLASEVVCPTCSKQLTINDVNTLSAGGDSHVPPHVATMMRATGMSAAQLVRLGGVSVGGGPHGRGPSEVGPNVSGHKPQGSSVATRRLMKELQAIRKGDAETQGFSVDRPTRTTSTRGTPTFSALRRARPSRRTSRSRAIRMAASSCGSPSRRPTRPRRRASASHARDSPSDRPRHPRRLDLHRNPHHARLGLDDDGRECAHLDPDEHARRRRAARLSGQARLPRGGGARGLRPDDAHARLVRCSALCLGVCVRRLASVSSVFARTVYRFCMRRMYTRGEPWRQYSLGCPAASCTATSSSSSLSQSRLASVTMSTSRSTLAFSR